MDNVTAIVVESNTLDLTRSCVDSLLRFYPSIHLIIVDNNSDDGSREWVTGMIGARGDIAILNSRNVGHGPAMHQALTLCETHYALLLDSDCIVLKAGWIGLMLEQNAYAVGKCVHVDAGGIIRKKGVEYIHPACMLLDVAQYLTLTPFNHHGMPCMLNQRAAREAGYWLAAFDTDEYVHHLWAGTRKQYGYQVDGWVRLERPWPHQARSAAEMLAENTVQIVASIGA